jgi:tetratricopeptide (TPR) repeat protein
VPVVTTASAPAGSDEPKSAAGYASRGADLLSRQQYPQAVEAFSRAVAIDPADPEHLIDLAHAHVWNHQRDLAMTDLDQALKLRPDNVRALMGRGALRLGNKDISGAQSDFDAALSHDSSVRTEVADDYSVAGLYEQAIANYDQWIASHPRNADLAQPLNGRCWARALLGRDLDKALADCNESLRLWSGRPGTLDTRGLVFLRMGELDEAIADYTAALKLQPNIAWSLYGRGLAKRLKGQTAAGDADIAAAVAIQPQIADEAKKNGIGS